MTGPDRFDFDRDESEDRPDEEASSDAVPMDWEHGYWRDGKRLVVLNGTLMPPQCVKCNETADRPPLHVRVKKPDNPGCLTVLAMLFLPLVGDLLLLLTRSVTSRTCVSFDVFVCDACHRRRRMKVISALAFIGAGIGLVALGARSPFFTLLGLLFVLAGLVRLIIVRLLLRYTWRDDAFAEIKKVHPDFLRNAPPWPQVG